MLLRPEICPLPYQGQIDLINTTQAKIDKGKNYLEQGKEAAEYANKIKSWVGSGNMEQEEAERAILNEEKEKSRIEGCIDNTYELALSLSKRYNCSFESVLDEFRATPEVRKLCMERYRNSIG